MTIQYIEGTNLAYCNGIKFRKDKRTGYWLTTSLKPAKRLHVYVWEHYNGPVPEGFHVHHLDRNKDNNDISNFELLSDEEHHIRHVEELTDARRAQMRENMLNKAHPAAAEWHKSEEGKAWHKKQYEATKSVMHQEQDYVCEQCGKPFRSKTTTSRFCSNACKSAFRRANAMDLEARICPVCGKEFNTPKYTPAQCCSRSCANILMWRARRNK